jgi:hypothetical protein
MRGKYKLRRDKQEWASLSTDDVDDLITELDELRTFFTVIQDGYSFTRDSQTDYICLTGPGYRGKLALASMV